MRYFTIALMAGSLLVVGCSKKHKHKHDSKGGHDHSMMGTKAMDGMKDPHAGHDHSMHGMGDAHKGHDHSMHGMGDAHKGHDHAMAAGAKVTVSKAGQAFKPPIKKAQLPDGVWFCDMGTVEYARGEKGDGTCPICKMKLKQLAAK